MKKDFLIYFNTISNLFLLMILLLGGIIWADSNGIWTDAKDIRGGTFGSDEQPDTTNFTFINPVYFNDVLKTINSNYYIDIDARTQLNDLATQKINTNNLTLPNQISCSKLYTNINGTILCGTDNTPLSGFGISVNNNNISVDPTVVQKRVSSTCPADNYMYGINSDGTVLCRADQQGSSGGGVTCSPLKGKSCYSGSQCTWTTYDCWGVCGDPNGYSWCS